MRVEIVLGTKQPFGLVCIRVKLQPLFVGRLRDTVRSDARRLQPSTDAIHTVLWWSENVVDLVHRQVFPIAM